MTELQENAVGDTAAPKRPVPDPGERAKAVLASRMVQDAWRIAAAAVIAAVALSIVALVVLNIGGSSAHLSTGVLKPYDDLLGPAFLVIVIASLTLGGQLSVDGQYVSSPGSGGSFLDSLAQSAGSSASLSGSLTLMPLLLTAAVLVVVALWTRRVVLTATGAGASWWQTGLVAGGMTAIAMEALAGITTARADLGGFEISASAAGWRLLIGAFAIVFVATGAGHALSRSTPVGSARLPRPVRWALGSFSAFGPRWRAFAAVVTVFTLVFLVVGLAGLVLIAFQTSTPGLVLGALPLLLGPAALAAGSLGVLGELDWNFAAGSSSSATDALSVLGGPAALWVTVLAMLVAVVLSAVVLHWLEPAGRRQPVWVLPLQFAGAWFVAQWTIGVIAGEVSGGLLGMSQTGTASASMAVWTFLLAGGVAFGVEGMARIIVPAFLRSGRFAEVDPTRVRLGAIIVGALVVVAIGASVLVALLNSAVFSATRAVADYTGAISSGDVKRAAQIVPADGGLPAPAPNADGRMKVESVKSTSVSSDGRTASVQVQYLVAGHHETAELTAVRRPAKLLGLFDQWRVTTSLQRTVIVDTPLTGDVSINGQRMIQRAVLSGTVYPGVYSATVTDGSSRYVTLSGGGRIVVTGGEDTVQMAEKPTSALAPAVSADIKRQLDACAPTLNDLDGGDTCPVSADDSDSWDDASNISWTLDSYPVMEVDGQDYDAATCGTATARFNASTWYGDKESQTTQDSCAGGSGSVSVSKGGLRLAYDGDSEG